MIESVVTRQYRCFFVLITLVGLPSCSVSRADEPRSAPVQITRTLDKSEPVSRGSVSDGQSHPQETKLNGPPLADVPTWSELARAILLTAIPDKYEDLKHWGKTRSVFDGLKVQ